MDGGNLNSDPVRSLDEIIRQSEAVDRDCKFLFESNESKSFRDHARRCTSDELCRCGVFSFPEIRSLKTDLFADSGHVVPAMTQIARQHLYLLSVVSYVSLIWLGLAPGVSA